MAIAFERRQPADDALAQVVMEWRQRPPLSDAERLYLLAEESKPSSGGAPPEPSVVVHAMEDHQAMVTAVTGVYRGRPLGPHGCIVFRSPADAAAAAMEIQARQLEMSLTEGALPMEMRTVISSHSL